ncbi:hypothetical protein DFH27DRAFT_478616 [Peziza echinospora]|nr:hypothetical protein DFH27DRAFT_478616 [Peziza echinospora]
MAWYCHPCERYFNSERSLDQHIDNSAAHRYQPRFDHVCEPCNIGFHSLRDYEAHEKDVHNWCKEHDRYFSSKNNLDVHLRSAQHAGRTKKCPACNLYFPSYSAVALHMESGSCNSGMTRYQVDQTIRQRDTNHIVTQRLLTYGSNDPAGEANIWATEQAYDHYTGCYGCYFCDKNFASLGKLNAHITLRHAQKRTNNVYTCPASSCREGFTYFSGLMQHIESNRCEASRVTRTRGFLGM